MTEESGVFSRGIAASRSYAEGSAACRNYSTLTLQVRTISQHTLIGYVIGIAVFLAYLLGGERDDPPLLLWWVLYLAGLSLQLLSISMAMIGWHFQSAFEAIRNALASMEKDMSFPGTGPGPWMAHQAARPPVADWLSTYVPYASIGICGLVISGIGVGQIWTFWTVWCFIAMFLLVVSVFWWLAANSLRHARHRGLARDKVIP